jgi:hypothetical protein
MNARIVGSLSPICVAEAARALLITCELAVVLAASACRQIVDFDNGPNRSRSDGGAGASSVDGSTIACGLPYDTTDCAACAATNCCNESAACALSNSCALNPTCTPTAAATSYVKRSARSTLQPAPRARARRMRLASRGIARRRVTSAAGELSATTGSRRQKRPIRAPNVSWSRDATT